MITNELTQLLRRFALRTPDAAMDARILAAIRHAVPCAHTCRAHIPGAPWVRWACLCPALAAAGVAALLLLSHHAGCYRTTPPSHNGTSAFFESVCTTTTHDTFIDVKSRTAVPATPPTPRSAPQPTPAAGLVCNDPTGFVPVVKERVGGKPVHCSISFTHATGAWRSTTELEPLSYGRLMECNRWSATCNKG